MVNMCYAYGWLFDDDTIRVGFIVCEAPGHCGIMASFGRGGTYSINIIKRTFHSSDIYIYSNSLIIFHSHTN